MNIGILISGHVRDYDYDNIKTNVIDVLSDEGKNRVDIFMSLWKVNERRVGGSLLEWDLMTDVRKFNPVKVNIEQNKRKYFIDNYRTKNFAEFVGPETAADATSMWYKIYDAKKMLDTYSRMNEVKYDVIVRIRTDTTYYNKLCLDDIKNCINDNSFYLAEWHKKYRHVTQELMDSFFFGNYEVMSKICNTYLNISEYMNQKIEGLPDTSETFLFKTITKNNIPIRRTGIKYGLIRQNPDGTIYVENMTTKE